MPLPAGCGDAEWLGAFAEFVEPAVRAFDPDLLLVSAGFDAHEEEDIYLVEMRVSDDGFGELAQRCAALAPRLAAVLEGGYNLATLPRLVGGRPGGLLCSLERGTAGFRRPFCHFATAARRKSLGTDIGRAERLAHRPAPRESHPSRRGIDQ